MGIISNLINRPRRTAAEDEASLFSSSSGVNERLNQSEYRFLSLCVFACWNVVVSAINHVSYQLTPRCLQFIVTSFEFPWNPMSSRRLWIHESEHLFFPSWNTSDSLESCDLTWENKTEIINCQMWRAKTANRLWVTDPSLHVQLKSFTLLTLWPCLTGDDGSKQWTLELSQLIH